MRRISAVAAVFVAVLACRSTIVDSTSILAAGRHLNGDVIVLSMSGSFTDFAQVRSPIQQDSAVEHATIFMTLPVRASAASNTASAVLKLEPLDDLNAKELGLARGTLIEMQSQGGDLPVAIGSLLAKELHVQQGDRFTIDLSASHGSSAARCLIAGVVHLGIEHFDRQLIVADVNQSLISTSDPTGIEIRLFQPARRVSFADHLEQRLGKRFRAIPLEELVAPLLNPKHADAP